MTNETPIQSDKSHDKGNTSELFQGVLWWTMLAVAVLVVPSIALAVTLALPLGEAGQIFVFMITCWVSTWIGMWLMRKAK